MKMKTIHLKDEISEHIAIRAILRETLSKINSKTVIDFSGVSSISRSCADEYAQFKEQIKYVITEEHLSSEVAEMIALVVESRKRDSPRPTPQLTPLEAIPSL